MGLGRLLFVLAVLVEAVLAYPAASQERAAQDSLTLKDCVEIALRNNSDIINARYNVDISDVSLQSSKGALLPSISTNYGANKAITGPRATGQIIDPATGQLISATGQSQVSGSQGVGASLDMPIYNANLLSTIAANRAGLRVTEQTLQNTRVTTINTVKRQFFQVLQAEKLLDLNKESVRVSEESFRRAQTMYEIGSAPVSDVLTARSNLETRKVTVITQQNAVDIARSNLAFTLGLDVNQPIRLKEGAFTVQPIGMTYEQALGNALDHRPNLKAQKFTLEQNQRQLEGARSSIRRPIVAMSAGYGWNTQNAPFRGIEDLFLQNYNYTFGVSVRMPIFNGMTSENTIRQRKLQYTQLVEQLRRIERQVALEVKQSLLNLDRSRQQIDAQNEAVKAAEEDFRLAEERYNFGAGTILERLQAQERLFAAKNNYINATYGYQQELANLEAALGGPEGE